MSAATKKAAVEVEVATVTLALSKETPGTYVFDNDTEGVAVKKVYVAKSAYPEGKKPKTVTLAITSTF